MANPSAAGCTTVGALRQQPPGQFAVDVLAVHFNVVCIMGTQYRADLPRYASFYEQYVGDGTLRA